LGYEHNDNMTNSFSQHTVDCTGENFFCSYKRGTHYKRLVNCWIKDE